MTGQIYDKDYDNGAYLKAGMSNLRSMGWMCFLEALGWAPMLIGLPQCHLFSSLVSVKVLGDRWKLASEGKECNRTRSRPREVKEGDVVKVLGKPSYHAGHPFC